MTMYTAVVGHPITHSLSPLFHNAIYKHEGIDAEMIAIDSETIEPVVQRIRETPLHLCAITLPHKQTILPLLDTVDSVAERIGAVNTVLNRDGVLYGYNTDLTGIAEALKDVPLSGMRALIIGAGGAAQPLVYFLKGEGMHVSCLSRHRAKTEELCARFGAMALAEIPDTSFDLIVNATPLGLKGDDVLPCPETLLTPRVTVFDLIYTPTRLQHVAEEKGARVITGLPMFVAQGLEQERLWLGRKIEDSGYSTLLQQELHRRQ